MTTFAGDELHGDDITSGPGDDWPRDISGDPYAIPANRIPPSRPARAEFTAALRELADFIDAHPDLPLPPYANGTRVSVFPYLDGTDTEGRRGVDQVAGILGVTPEENESGTHYEATRVFGGRITYQATAITAEQMRHHHAEQSYVGAVVP